MSCVHEYIAPVQAERPSTLTSAALFMVPLFQNKSALSKVSLR